MPDSFFTNLIVVAYSSWPVWLPVLLLLLFYDIWISYLHRLYRANLTWVFIEVRLPREILRGPRIMDQLFASLYSVSASPGDWYERYWIGETALWYSFEIASHGGEVHFYIRAPARYKNIVEAIIYSFYPEVEIQEVGDYVEELPSTTADLYAMGYDLWGSELILAKDDGYPIRTYREFESMDEYVMVDPIAALMEVFAKLRPDESVWLQFVISPADSKWRERGQQLIKELKEQTRAAGVIGGSEYSMVDRTPGQVQVMKAIEENIAKSGFFTKIRVIYIAPAASFNKDIANKGIVGAFNQYASQAMNNFRHDYSKRTITGWYNWPHFFPKWRLEYRKQQILRRFKARLMPWASSFGLFSHGGTVSRQQTFVLNTEELATLYHFPTKLVVTAPMIRRVEAKKAGPPAGLPIYGAEAAAEEQLPPGFTFK